MTRTQRGGGSGPAAVGSCPISAWQCKGSVIAGLGACAQCMSLHSVRQHPRLVELVDSTHDTACDARAGDPGRPKMHHAKISSGDGRPTC